MIVTRPLVHNGRLYNAGDRMLDLPDPEKLERFIMNRVLVHENEEITPADEEITPEPVLNQQEASARAPKADGKK